jgi:hypothetical protein
MPDAIIGLAGALLGGGAAIAGAALQARSAASLQLERTKEDESRRHVERAEQLQERQRALARRYLFQLGEAVDSLLHRVDNWLRRGGQHYAGARKAGYWETTTLYAIARALGAERLLALDAVYLDLQALWPDSRLRLQPRAIEDALRDAVGQGFFQYDRLALSEAVLARADEGFRLLIYSEFLHRYNDPAWKELLEPARDALDSVSSDELRQLEHRLTDVKQRVGETIGTLATLSSGQSAER